MIEKLKGICAMRTENSIVLDVNGVGYGLEMPLSDLCDMAPSDKETEVWVHTYVREDAIRLFGFLGYEDKYLFGILLSTSGVGPKVALAILSTLSAGSLRQAVILEQTSALEVVPGIGPKLAKKIVFEFKPKLEKLPSSLFGAVEGGGVDVPESSTDSFGANKNLFLDLRSALSNLGYKDKEITKVCDSLKSTDEETPELSSLIKRALQELRDGIGSSSTQSSKTDELF